MIAQRVLQHRRRATIGNVCHLDTERLRQHEGGEMPGRTRAGVSRARRRCLHPGDQFRQRIGDERLPSDQQQGVGVYHGDRDEIFFSIERQRFVERDVGRDLQIVNEQRVAVGSRARHALTGDIGAAAADILDDEALPELGREFRRKLARNLVGRAADARGKLIIPAFAIGRVEEVLYWLRRLEAEGRIPVLPVFVDIPMAAKALQFYASRADELDPDISVNARTIGRFCTQRLTIVSSVQQSVELVASKQSAIVIASSGWKASSTVSSRKMPS